jgi:hypothetical protein
MNGYETGEMIVLAIHYYAPRSVEKAFINDALGGRPVRLATGMARKHEH